MAELYYLFDGEVQSGPFVLNQLTTMWQNGAITADSQFWKEGMAQWDPILSIATLLNPPPPAPAKPPPFIARNVPPPLPKEAIKPIVTEIVPKKEYDFKILDDGRVHFSTTTLNGAKQGLQEVKLTKKAIALEKRNLQARAKQIRQNYTQYTRRRGHMFRGGRSFGRIIRIFQAADRDGHQRQLAHSLAPLEREMDRMDRIILNLDQVITQVVYTIQNARG